MSEFVKRKPDFSGDGVAVWTAVDKNEKPYLTIKVLNSINLKAFSNDKEEVAEPEIKPASEIPAN